MNAWARRFHGTASELLVSPPDDWGGRAAAAWAERLAQDRSFDPAAEWLVDVAQVIDRIYTAQSRPAPAGSINRSTSLPNRPRE